jgi:hypothetical protein
MTSPTVPFAELPDRLRHALDGLGVVVEAVGPDRVRVQADLADATYLSHASAHHEAVVRGVEVVARGAGHAVVRDYTYDLDLSAGQGRLRGSARFSSGRSVRVERRIVWGVGTDGRFGRQVDFTWSSQQLRGAVVQVLRDTGWYAGWWSAQPLSARFGLVMAGLGATAIPGVPIALLVEHYSQK